MYVRRHDRLQLGHDLHCAVLCNVLSQCVVHAGMPAFTGRLEVGHNLWAISHRYRYLGGTLLCAALARQVNFSLSPVGCYGIRIVWVIRACGVVHTIVR